MQRSINEIKGLLEDTKFNGSGIAVEYLNVCNNFNVAIDCIEDEETKKSLRDESFSINALSYASNLISLETKVASFMDWLEKHVTDEMELAKTA